MMLVAVTSALSLSLRTPLASPHSRRAPVVHLNAAAWAPVDSASTRKGTVDALGSLKADGSAKLWGEFKLVRWRSFESEPTACR